MAVGTCQPGAKTCYPSRMWLSDSPLERHRARAACQSCPLLDSCRDYALHGLVIESGVRMVVGGMTEREIRAARKAQGIKGPSPLPPPRPVKKPKLLAVTTSEEKEALKVRQAILASHTRTGHPNPVPGCPRCTNRLKMVTENAEPNKMELSDSSNMNRMTK